MKIKEKQEVMIFKNENQETGKKYYQIGLSRKDRNGTYFNGYMQCQFKNGIEVENKTRIRINDAFISFYLKDKNTIPYVMILDFEIVENKEEIEILPF